MDIRKSEIPLLSCNSFRLFRQCNIASGISDSTRHSYYVGPIDTTIFSPVNITIPSVRNLYHGTTYGEVLLPRWVNSSVNYFSTYKTKIDLLISQFLAFEVLCVFS